MFVEVNQREQSLYVVMNINTKLKALQIENLRITRVKLTESVQLFELVVKVHLLFQEV